MIRRYQPDDLSQLIEVWHKASLVAHPFLDAEFLEQERVEIETRWLPIAETWVFAEDERIVGFIALIDHLVGGLFVDPAQHGRGIGRRLMDHAGRLRQSLEVEVFEANTIGRSFYEACGFEVTDRSVHAPTGQVMLRMRSRLP